MFEPREAAKVDEIESINSSGLSIELVCNYACHIGENPLWHPLEHQLYWTDIPTGRMFRYQPGTGSHTQIYSGRPVGGFTFEEDRGLLLFMDRGTISRWNGKTVAVCLADIPAERASRFNDVIADPCGRVFCGTMATSDAGGRLYRLDTDGLLHLLLEDVGCSNGMGFSCDLSTFYYTDSFAREIYCFDYDVIDGSIANRRTFARFDETGGLPDGLCVDDRNRVWSALWDGSAIVRLTERGVLSDRISLQVPKISSLTFGGDAFGDLYITTAGGDQRESDGPLAGALFRIRAGFRGRPENFSQLRSDKIRLA